MIASAPSSSSGQSWSTGGSRLAGHEHRGVARLPRHLKLCGRRRPVWRRVSSALVQLPGRWNLGAHRCAPRLADEGISDSRVEHRGRCRHCKRDGRPRSHRILDSGHACAAASAERAAAGDEQKCCENVLHPAYQATDPGCWPSSARRPERPPPHPEMGRRRSGRCGVTVPSFDSGCDGPDS
jgi:hypothetical protein